MLEIRSYVPLATQSKFAAVVPADLNIDVITDQFPAAVPGDYIEYADAEGTTPVRAWAKAEFDALFALA